ncbi:MAG: hypothetical protein MJZ37_00055 [Bacilli bacterium]|nr:hypothetical protein [Bacilli bacterium]
MTKAEFRKLTNGTQVTFKWAGKKRTGVFQYFSSKYPTKALILWQKDNEDKPHNHQVSFQALHTPESDKADKAKALAEAKAKAERKAEREAKSAVKAQKNLDNATDFELLKALADRLGYSVVSK